MGWCRQANVDPDLCYHIASLGHNELTPQREHRCRDCSHITKVIVAVGMAVFNDSWYWRHDVEAFTARLAICEGRPPVTKGPVILYFDGLFVVNVEDPLNKQSTGQ